MRIQRSSYLTCGFFSFVALTALWIGGLFAHAATVQGIAVCANQNTPAYNAAISVFRADIGQSNLAAVGENGVFYLYNIPAGIYVMQVWSRSNPSLAPLLFTVSVFEPLTSLPVLRLPC